MAKKTAKASRKKTTAKRPAGKKQAKSVRASKQAPDLQSKLATLLEKPKTAKKCMAFFRKLSEEQRRELAPFCFKWYEKVWKDDMIEVEPGTFVRNPLLDSAQLAAFWTTDLKGIGRLGRWFTPGEHALEILSHRKPDWIDGYVEQLLGSRYYWNNWALVRELIKRKLCKKPDNPRYYTAMIGGLVTWRNKSTVLAELKKDPALLRDELWRLFEYVGDDENTLANRDRFDKTGWAGAIVSLSKAGKLQRQKLLDAAISAMGIGFNHYRAKWFFGFFDEMEPTAVELKKRSGALLDLLDNPAPNVVKWAFGKVGELLKSGVLKDTGQLVDAVRPMLTSRQKGTVKDALRLLTKLGEHSPHAVALAATEALGHEKVDVQKQGFALVKRFGDEASSELRDAVEKYMPVVASTNKKLLREWLDKEAALKKKTATKRSKASATQFDRKTLRRFDKQHVELLGINALINAMESGRATIPAATFDGTDIPRLDPNKRLSPITDLEELIEVAARVIEDDSLVDDGERVLEGFSLLCDQRPDNFDRLVGPLYKRSLKLMKRTPPFGALGVASDVCGLVYCWVTGQKVSIKIKPRTSKYDSETLTYSGLDGIAMRVHSYHADTPIAFLSQRCNEIGDRVADRHSQPLLSSPTHEGGWIAATELVRRVNRLQAKPTETDVVLAMLRLAPEVKRAALQKLKTKLSGEWLNAIKYALGAGRVKLGKSSPLWVAACRSRTPLSDDERVAKAFPKLGPDCGRAARYEVDFKARTNRYDGRNYTHYDLYINTTEPKPKKQDVRLPTQTLHMSAKHERFMSYPYGYSTGSKRWIATMWPIARDSYFSMGGFDIGTNLDWWEAEWSNRTYMEPLLDSDTPLRQMGLLLLLLGLAAKEPGEHGLATDATIQAIQDGRLGTDNLGEALATYLPTGCFKLPRWAARFDDISQASALHGHVVLHGFSRALRGDWKQPPRGLGELLEMLIEIAARLDTGISDPACREVLGSIAGSSKAAKAARMLLSLDATSDSRVAFEQAIRHRIDRLESWKER